MHLEMNKSLADSVTQLNQAQSSYLRLLDYYQSQTYMENLDLSNKGYLLFDRPNLASQLRELADMLEQ